MREKINQLAKEQFEYELPKIVLSTDSIFVQVQKEEEKTVTFHISCEGNFSREGNFSNEGKLSKDGNCMMKCFFICNSPYVKLSTEEFSGNQIELELRVLVKDFEAGQKIEDKLVILSNYGERTVPITIEVVDNYCETTMGTMKDLFQFANLAKMNQEEAVSLFKTEEFERVFLHRKSDLLLYQSLIKGNSSKLAMEEFLVAIHKKLKILFSIPKETYFYEIENEKAFRDTILIKKDNWGYSELKISSDSEFLIPEHKRVWSSDFTANKYELEYVIEPKFMRKGKNFAKLIIESAHQKFEVVVTAWKKDNSKDIVENRFAKKEGLLKIFQNYINFCMNHIAKDVYISETEELLKKGESYIDEDVVLLARLYISMLKGEEKQPADIMELLSVKELNWEKREKEKYKALLYLRKLQTKKDLDYSYEEKKSKEELLEDYLEAKVHSPFLYYEWVTYYNKYPTSLKTLTRKNMVAFHWGVKNKCIEWNLMLQYASLARKEKSFLPLVYRDLVTLYETYQSDEVLSVICSLLIRNQKTEKEYFKWYELGVKKQLRITSLFEYYLYSCDEENITELPETLLLYFQYDNNLSVRKKAFLYSYLIQNKEKHKMIYEQYEHKILNFTENCLKKKSKDKNMTVLYQEMIEQGHFSNELAKRVAEVMFQYELVCDNDNMQGVIVRHKESEEEVYTPFVDGKAVISIFTEQPCILFLDSNGNRYGKTVSYTMNKLNHLENYEKDCYKNGSRNPMLLLNMFEKIEQYQKNEKDTKQICDEVIKIPSLTPLYRKRVLMGLLEENYETMDSNSLEEVLDLLDFSKLNKEERTKVIEICIIYDRESKALVGLEEYGFHGIRSNRLLRLITKWIRERKDERNEFVIKFAQYMFSIEKYNAEILSYLVQYGKGASRDLFSLWEKATDFDVETENLEERLLYQVLFTEHCSQKYFKVFASYNKRGKNAQLIHAFLCFQSYRYVVHDRVLHERLFELLEKESKKEESKIICLALLKYYSTLDTLSEEVSKFVEYTIHQMLEEGIVLPFFHEFKGKVVVPYEIQDKYFVEYKCSPKKRVIIHYRIDGEDTESEFKTELMKPVYNGIFVKDFVLFYNESLQYYIEEEENWADSTKETKRHITESVSTVMDSVIEEKELTSYHMLNDMLLAREMQDEKTLFELMKHYIQLNHVGSNVFKLL